MEPPISAPCLCARPSEDRVEDANRCLAGPLCHVYGRRGWPIEEIAVHYGVRAPRELPPCAWDAWERGLDEGSAVDDDDSARAELNAHAEGEDDAMETERVFTLDGETVDLEELIEANRETFDEDEIEALRAMRPGESITFGGGAWAESVVACAAAEAPC